MTLLAGSEAVSARTSYQQQLDVWVLLNETTSQPLFFSGVSFSLSMSYLCWLQDMISDLTIVPLRSGLSLQLRFCFLCFGNFPIVFPGQRRGQIFGLHRVEGPLSVSQTMDKLVTEPGPERDKNYRPIMASF